MTERLIVVGAGAAGLNAAWHARRRGVEALLIDAAERPGGAWARMDPAMRCLSPRELDRLADGSTPEGPGRFATAAEVLEAVRAFAAREGFRSRMGQRVTSVRRVDGVLELDTTGGPIRTLALVAATGIAGSPHALELPGAFAGAILPAFGLHARETTGSVLVIGAGNSGADAIDLLLERGHDVVLSSRQALRSQPPFPEGLAGRVSWLASGVPVRFLPPALRSGEVLPVGDRITRHVDAGLRVVGEAVALEPGGVRCLRGPGARGVPEELVAVDTVVVATGFDPDLVWLRGLTGPDIVTLGIDGQRTRRSGFLRGFDDDARHAVRRLLGGR